MAMTQSETSAYGADAIEGAEPEWPLKFKRHSFGAFCFDTIGCHIAYDGFAHGSLDDDRVSPPLSSYEGTPHQMFRAMHLGRRNFPPPAQVRWRSKDGVPHEAEVDIGAIFADELILHQVPREELYAGSIPYPAIVLVVDDRTISVYMRARLSTVSPQIPENRYSNFRNDLMLAWSRTY